MIGLIVMGVWDLVNLLMINCGVPVFSITGFMLRGKPA